MTQAADYEITREKAMEAFMTIREQSAKNFPDGMSLEKINDEIYKAQIVSPKQKPEQ